MVRARAAVFLCCATLLGSGAGWAQNPRPAPERKDPSPPIRKGGDRPGGKPTPAGEKKPPRFPGVPEKALAKVKVAPLPWTQAFKPPRRYPQRLTLTVDRSRRTGKTYVPTGRKVLEARVDTTYTARLERYVRFQSRFTMTRIEWRQGKEVRTIPLATMATWPPAAHPLRAALTTLAATPVRVVMGRGSEALVIKGYTGFLERLARPLEGRESAASFRESLGDLFAPHHLERTVLLLHPPILPPKGGVLVPGRGFYRKLHWGDHRLLLSHTYLGTCRVGKTRCAVFWSTLDYPGEPPQVERIRRRDWTVTVGASRLAGVVRVDPATGHTLDAGLELIRDRVLAAGGQSEVDRTTLRVRLATRAPKADKGGQESEAKGVGPTPAGGGRKTGRSRPSR